jgi:hypothetical protein
LLPSHLNGVYFLISFVNDKATIVAAGSFAACQSASLLLFGKQFEGIYPIKDT